MSFSFVLHLLRQPLYQALLFLLLTLISIPFLSSKNANAVWNVAGVLYAAFILANAVFSWFADNTWTYFFISLGYSLLYILIVGMLVPSLISALKISGSGESAGIFLFIIYHPLILLFIILVKWVIRSLM